MYRFLQLYLFLIISTVYGQNISILNANDGSVLSSPQLFCNGETFHVKVNTTATSTGDYAMTSLSSFNISNRSNPVPFKNKIGENHFSKPVPIPFTFSYFGKSYSHLVVGSNGRLVFGEQSELSLLQNDIYADQVHSGNLGQSNQYKIPSIEYNKVNSSDPAQILNLAHIFAGFTELKYNSESIYDKITYGDTNYEGKNALIVSFTNINERLVGGGYTSPLSNQIVLVEDGRIIIKVIKSSSGSNAILGLQNSDASKARWPVNNEPASKYNNGPFTNSSEAWVFTPSQQLTPQFKWFRNNVEIPGATSTSLTNFQPQNGDKLKVEVTYTEDPSIVETGEVIFNALQKPVVQVQNQTCSSVTLETALVQGATYAWFKAGETTPLPSTDNTATVTAGGQYYVRVAKNNSTCSLDSDPILVNLANNFPPLNPGPHYLCSSSGETQRQVNLNNYYPADPAQYKVEFFEGNTLVENPAAYLLLANQPVTITIQATALNATSCTMANDFQLILLSPPANGNTVLSEQICFGQPFYNLSDFENRYSGLNFTFTYSLDNGANFGVIRQIDLTTRDEILVKMQHPLGGCESVFTLKFDHYPEVQVRHYTPFPPHCRSDDEYFDLEITERELTYGPDILVTFYRDTAMTDQIFDLQYTGRGKVYVKIENTATGCLAQDPPVLELVVYDRPDLIKQSPEQKFSACGQRTFDLTTDIHDYIGSFQYPTVIKYFDRSGVELNEAEWKNYNPELRGQPYMQFIYNTTNNTVGCSDTIQFDLKYREIPAAQTSSIIICGQTSYALSDFKSKAISTPEDFIFTDEDGNELTGDFSISNLPFDFNFYLENRETGCKSALQTITFQNGSLTPVLKYDLKYALCDADSDGFVEFGLSTLHSLITVAQNVTFKYYKDAALTQPIPSEYTNETAFLQTVYIQVEEDGFCPVIVAVELIVNIPTTLIFSGNLDLCYDDTLYLHISNASDFTEIKWLSPNGEILGSSETFSLAYAQVQFGKQYQVVAKNASDCVTEYPFTPSDRNQPKITAIKQSNASIEVTAEGGTKPYIYYFNGIPQSTNILSNPEPKTYTIQVQSADGCLGPPKTVYFIKINNAFTPNADGKNDVWKIDYLDRMNDVKLTITDRFGNVMYQADSGADAAWNGTAAGQAVPTGTYWYVVSWTDPVTRASEQRQGWILLKNQR